MDKTRVICFRMPESLLAKLDRLAHHTYNNSRSQVVLQLLNNLVDCADDGTLYKMVNSYDAYGRGYKITFQRDENKLC